MNWSEADRLTKRGELWGFIDLSETFTQDTLDKYQHFIMTSSFLIKTN